MKIPWWRNGYEATSAGLMCSIFTRCMMMLYSMWERGSLFRPASAINGNRLCRYTIDDVTCSFLSSSWQNAPNDTISAIDAIHEFTQGIPRKINNLCYASLLSGFGGKKPGWWSFSAPSDHQWVCKLKPKGKNSCPSWSRSVAKLRPKSVTSYNCFPQAVWPSLSLNTWPLKGSKSIT